MFDDVLQCFCFRCFSGVPGRRLIINVSVQYNSGLLPDIILLTQCYYNRRTRLNYDEALYLPPMIPPTKRFDIFSPDWGCSEGLGAF